VRDPRIRVLFTVKGVTELASVDQAWIHAKYGIPGDRYMDYAILRGDPSDGLPGVRGIGEKTASQLLAKYGSLDGILAAKDLSPTIRARLNVSKDYLVAARRVGRAAPPEVAVRAIFCTCLLRPSSRLKTRSMSACFALRRT